jgi:hypothetical protein
LLSGKPGALLFLERERVTALWHAYDSIIVRRHVRYWPFSRPVNWWRFNAPEWRRDGETQRAYLERHPELLLPAERAQLRRMARKAVALELHRAH